MARKEKEREKEELPSIRLGARLGETLDQLQDRIRERAYDLFTGRAPGEGDSLTDWLQAQSELLAPVALELKEQKKAVVAECDLKGFSPKEVSVEVEGNVLKVFGTHRESTADKGKGKKATGEHSEQVVHFYQSTTLPCAVDLDAADAQMFKNGKLKVTLPKK